VIFHGTVDQTQLALQCDGLSHKLRGRNGWLRACAFLRLLVVLDGLPNSLPLVLRLLARTAARTENVMLANNGASTAHRHPANFAEEICHGSMTHIASRDR